MKKRLVAFFVSVILMLSIFPVSAATDGIVLVIDYEDNLPKTDESFNLTVSIKNNPGIYGIEFVLEFDKDELRCDKISVGELVGNAASTVTNTDVDGGAKFASVSLVGFDGDEVVAQFEFTAKETIKKADFALKDVIILNVNGKSVEYTVKNKNSEATTKPSRPSGSDGSDETQEQPKEDVVFPDVSDHWAKEYITKASQIGLFKGDTLGNFNPDSPVTRAQFVTVLYRMAGKPEVTDETPFADTKGQIEEFKSAIAWGYKNGYINGTSETTFDPDGTLTREAGMKILHYYSGGKIGGEIMVSAIYDGTFEDSKDISGWAKNSMYWGIFNKLISGTSEVTLTPQGTATRAQLAKILVNYIETYNKQEESRK